MTEQERDEFWQMLRDHDWGYMYSDDPAAHREGRAESARILKKLESNPELQPVYNAFCATRRRGNA